MATKTLDYFFLDDPPKQVQDKSYNPSKIDEITLNQPVIENTSNANSEQAVTQPITPDATQTRPSDLQTKSYNPSKIDEIDIAAQEQQPEATPEQEQQQKDRNYLSTEEIKAKYGEKFNPLYAMIKEQNPVIDEKRQDRLRKIAAVNSVGKGLGIILQGYYGKKGATITPDNNTLLSEVYKEYMSNVDEYEKKKDLWNKDMLSISLKKTQAEIEAEAAQEKERLLDARIKEQAVREAALQEARLMAQAAMQDAENKFKDGMAKADTEAKQDAARLEFQRDIAKIKESGNQSRLTIQENERAGKFKPKSIPGSSMVSRQPGTEDNPLAFRSDGKQIILNADQLDIIADILQKEAGNYDDANNVMFQSYLKKIASDGKITEAEARMILSRYGSKYYDFKDGKALPKGATSSEQNYSTAGAY